MPNSKPTCCPRFCFLLYTVVAWSIPNCCIKRKGACWSFGGTFKQPDAMHSFVLQVLGPRQFSGFVLFCLASLQLLDLLLMRSEWWKAGPYRQVQPQVKLKVVLFRCFPLLFFWSCLNASCWVLTFQLSSDAEMEEFMSWCGKLLVWNSLVALLLTEFGEFAKRRYCLNVWPLKAERARQVARTPSNSKFLAHRLHTYLVS